MEKNNDARDSWAKLHNDLNGMLWEMAVINANLDAIEKDINELEEILRPKP